MGLLRGSILVLSSTQSNFFGEEVLTKESKSQKEKESRNQTAWFLVGCSFEPEKRITPYDIVANKKKAPYRCILCVVVVVVSSGNPAKEVLLEVSSVSFSVAASDRSVILLCRSATPSFFHASVQPPPTPCMSHSLSLQLLQCEVLT